MPVVRQRFYIDPDGEDKDIHVWLQNIPKTERSKAIRETLRLGLGRTNADTIGEIVREIIREELTAATFQVTPATGGPSDPVFEDAETASIIADLVDCDL